MTNSVLIFAGIDLKFGSFIFVMPRLYLEICFQILLCKGSLLVWKEV